MAVFVCCGVSHLPACAFWSKFLSLSVSLLNFLFSLFPLVALCERLRGMIFCYDQRNLALKSLICLYLCASYFWELCSFLKSFCVAFAPFKESTIEIEWLEHYFPFSVRPLNAPLGRVAWIAPLRYSERITAPPSIPVVWAANVVGAAPTGKAVWTGKAMQKRLVDKSINKFLLLTSHNRLEKKSKAADGDGGWAKFWKKDVVKNLRSHSRLSTFVRRSESRIFLLASKNKLWCSVLELVDITVWEQFFSHRGRIFHRDLAFLSG